MTDATERRAAVIDFLADTKVKLTTSQSIEELLMHEFALEGALIVLNVLGGPGTGERMMVEARQIAAARTKPGGPQRR